MKKLTFLFGVTALLAVLSMCEKESDNDSVAGQIRFIETELGGCHGQFFQDLKNAIDEEKDTVIFTIKNDTLDIYVGINYICCAPFASETFISNDSIIVTINDTCSYPYQSCYCMCMCFYTWDFMFVDFEKKYYCFKIILNDPREEKPIIFKEGIVDLS